MWKSRKKFPILRIIYTPFLGDTHKGTDHAVSLRAKFLRRCEDVHALFRAQLLDQYTERHEHGTTIRSVAAVHDQRAARVGIVRLVHQLDETARHLRYFALHRRPAVILILLHDPALVRLRVQDAELATRVIRTALAMNVTDLYVIVIGLVVGPIPWTFPRAFI